MKPLTTNDVDPWLIELVARCREFSPPPLCSTRLYILLDETFSSDICLQRRVHTLIVSGETDLVSGSLIERRGSDTG